MPFWAMWTHIRSQSRPVRGHTRRFFPQTFVDGFSCLLVFDVFTPPEESRREEEHCVESGRPSGQEVRFTKPCRIAVASIQTGMWRRFVLCGRLVACEDISQQKGDKTGCSPEMMAQWRAWRDVRRKYRSLTGHYQLREKALIGCFALSGCLFMGRFYVLICRGSTHKL